MPKAAKSSFTTVCPLIRLSAHRGEPEVDGPPGGPGEDRTSLAVVADLSFGRITEDGGFGSGAQGAEAGRAFCIRRFLLPALLWTSASVDTADHKGEGSRTGRWDSTRPGSKRELAGAVPDQAEGNAAWLKLFSRCEQYERKSLLGLATAIENLSARLSRTK